MIMTTLDASFISIHDNQLFCLRQMDEDNIVDDQPQQRLRPSILLFFRANALR